MNLVWMMQDSLQSKGFVLHSRRFRENSRIIELFTRDHGRVAVVARVSRKKNAANTSKFQPFRELALQWRGKSELQSLQHADELQHFNLRSPANICGLYCNELILYLTSKFVPLPSLYEAYQRTLQRLGTTDGFEPVLRQFEITLLEELGYGLDLEFDHLTGSMLIDVSEYYFHPALGLSVANPGHGSVLISATVVEALRAQEFSQQSTAKAVKIMLGSAIDYLLDGRTLKSRQLYRDMVKIST